jgi:hypothetical protein
MVCDIDDLCKWFDPLYLQRLLQNGQRQRVHHSQLSLSEIMTIIVYFHSSHYRDFKHYYTEYVATHLRPYFPALVSYSRFVELMPRAQGHLVFQFNPNKSQRLCRLGRQPAASRRNVGMSRPPQEANGGVA